MGMFDKFPYRNTRDLNLNWIVKKIIYLEGVVGETVSDVAKFLSKKGGKMEGAIDMQNNRIFNVPTPAGDTDVATKKYVDDHSGGVSGDYLPLSGGTMTGAVNMGGNKIASVATPTADTDVATKKYVDDHSGGAGNPTTVTIPAGRYDTITLNKSTFIANFQLPFVLTSKSTTTAKNSDFQLRVHVLNDVDGGSTYLVTGMTIGKEVGTNILQLTLTASGNISQITNAIGVSLTVKYPFTVTK